MKATVKENETFKPITIELVIESEQELCDLWLRMNQSGDKINDDNTSLKYQSETFCPEKLWKALNNEVNRLKLKK
jgi:hypothetical protein